MLDQYYRINQAAGIAINIQTDGSILIYACGIAANNKTLDITKKISGLPALKELQKELPAKTAVGLNISGKGVLNRQIEKTEEITPANFNKVLPNANYDDFYIQNFVSGEYSFVSVIRKTEADRWISQVTECGFNILTLSLGPFVIDHILPQLNFYGLEIQFDGHHVRLNEQKHWTAYQHNPTIAAAYILKVENEQIDEKLIIPYAMAFQLILATKLELIESQVDHLQLALKSKLDQLKLKTQGFLILAIFFVLLLANFVILSALNSTNAELTTQVSRSAQSSSDVEQITEQVKQKEALLQLLGWDSGINKSALVDQIASLLPEEVKWTEVDVNPLDLAGSRIEKIPVFFNRRIKVNGTSEKIIPVNEWIARIKTAKWVKHVQMESYTFNNELNTGQFTIIIEY